MGNAILRSVTHILSALIGAGGIIGAQYVQIAPGPRPTSPQILSSEEYKQLINTSAAKDVAIAQLKNETGSLRQQLSQTVELSPEYKDLQKQISTRDTTITQLRTELETLKTQSAHPSQANTVPSAGNTASSDQTIDAIIGEWRGRSKRGLPMILEITRDDTGGLAGFANFPSDSNAIFALNVEQMPTIPNLVEASKARYLGITDTRSPQSYFKMDTKKYIQGNDRLRNGVYRATIVGQRMYLVMFGNGSASEPAGEFELKKQ